MEKKSLLGKMGRRGEVSFKPEINATSEVIVESDPNRGVETEEDRIMRLYKKD
jgi:hypothetical protein